VCVCLYIYIYIYDFVALHKIQILFFDWFELYYAFENHIAYPFTKDACPITTRNKTPSWELANGSSIESEYPPLRNLKIPHKDQIVEDALYKSPNKDVITNTKHIIQENNFTRTNLNTIGKQLTIREKHIQKSLFAPVEQKLKHPVFKPYQVIKAS